MSFIVFTSRTARHCNVFTSLLVYVFIKLCLVSLFNVLVCMCVSLCVRACIRAWACTRERLPISVKQPNNSKMQLRSFSNCYTTELTGKQNKHHTIPCTAYTSSSPAHTLAQAILQTQFAKEIQLAIARYTVAVSPTAARTNTNYLLHLSASFFFRLNKKSHNLSKAAASLWQDGPQRLRKTLRLISFVVYCGFLLFFIFIYKP